MEAHCIYVFPHLLAAQAVAKEWGDVVYARDKMMNATNPGSKYYAVTTAMRLYVELRFTEPAFRCYYEVIEAEKPSRLYFNIESTRPDASALDVVSANLAACFLGDVNSELVILLLAYV